MGSRFSRCQVIASLIPIFLLIDGPNTGLKLLYRQAKASLLCLLLYCLISKPIPNQYAGRQLYILIRGIHFLPGNPNQYAGRPSLVWRKVFLPSQLDTDRHIINMREGSEQALNLYGENPNQYAGNQGKSKIRLSFNIVYYQCS